MARLVRFRVLDGVAVVTLDAPPVNALSAPLRGGLWDVFGRIATNPDIKAAVLMAAGTMFSAGADIRELAGEGAQPSLAQLCDRIEGCPKPVVAALHGQALGGGMELALAAHYRVAAPDARIGLPEVTLGLIPGAGGTQRLPRLIGAEHALQMMIGTQAIDAGTAQRIGLIDGVVQGRPGQNMSRQDVLGSGAIAFAKTLLGKGQGPRPTRANRSHFANGRAHAAAVAQARVALDGNPLHAPERVVDCVEAAALLPFEAGLAFEADAFARCLAHPQSVALRHVFMAERRADAALLDRDGNAFRPVDPMGKAAALRLRKAMRAAGDYLVTQGRTQADVDAAMVGYGFRKGPFGGRIAGPAEDTIVRRILAAMVTEGAVCVDQGAVQRASDIDALAVHALGFPRRRGGPMRAAQTDGLIALRRDMRDWAEEGEAAATIWAVPALMDAAIKQAAGFDALPQ